VAALEDLSALLANLPNYTLLTDTMKQDALSGALVPDTNGVWPGQPDYITTYDIYFAAVRLIGFLMAQPVVRQSSSEGTSVAVDAPSWGGLLEYYRSQSPILQATTNGPVLTKVLIPEGPHVYHTDMTGVRGGNNDNVDTDLG
jgi:hypothetical protein